MEINYKFYNHDLIADDSIVEQINSFINNENMYESVYDFNDTNVIIALSEIRENIISWYPIKDGAEVLEIGGNFGAITKELCKKSKKVVTIEFSKERAQILQKRCNEFKNLDIIVGKIDEINIEQKFDYITLIDIIEDSNKIIGDFSNNYEATVELLKHLKKYLKEDGKILVALDNKYGVKYLAGGVNKKEEKPYEYLMDISKRFSKEQFEKIIDSVGFNKTKYYYPLPDFRLANVIYSDEYIPVKNSAKLKYNIYYNNNSKIIFDEIKAINSMTEDGKFEEFTNSYFIELSNSEEVCNTKFVCFNNMRKKETRLVTQINGDEVIKAKSFPESEEFMRNYILNIEKIKSLGFNSIESLKEGKITSPYLNIETLSQFLVKKVKRGNIDIFYKTMDTWYQKLKLCLGVSENYEINEDSEGLNITLNGFIDLTFDNVFYDGQEYYVFDQEWYKESIPIEYILYRSIRNMYSYNSELNSILDIQEVFSRYKLNLHVDYFEKLEKEFQNNVVDAKISQFYNLTYDNILYLDDFIRNYKELMKQKDYFVEQNDYLIKENNNINEKISQLDKIINEQNNQNDEQGQEIAEQKEIIQNQERVISELSKELETIKKSRIWKIANIVKRNDKNDK